MSEVVVTVRRCGTCAHWDRSLDARYPDFGECAKVEWLGWSREQPDVVAYVTDAEDYSAGLYTRAEFGCVLWEGKA